MLQNSQENNYVGVSFQTCNFIKKKLQPRCFSVNIIKFSRTPFSQSTFGRLFLHSSAALSQLTVRNSYLTKRTLIKRVISGHFCSFLVISAKIRHPNMKNSTDILQMTGSCCQISEQLAKKSLRKTSCFRSSNSEFKVRLSLQEKGGIYAGLTQ